jgi:hypothetical protein
LTIDQIVAERKTATDAEIACRKMQQIWKFATYRRTDATCRMTESVIPAILLIPWNNKNLM